MSGDGLDRGRPRDRDLVGLHLTVLPHRRASRGVDGAPVRRSRSRGSRSTSTPSTRRRGSRAPSSRRATARARRTASASWFEDEGLVYAPPPEVVSNTRLALELGEGAREEGLHRAYHDRVMDAYWAEGIDLSAARGAGGARARGVGMSDDGIARALDDRAWSPVVDASTARAQSAGATGVPAFVIDWRVLVVGAQPREMLAQAIAQARARGSRAGIDRRPRTSGDTAFEVSEHLADDGDAPDDGKDDDEDEQPAYENYTSKHGAGDAPASGAEIPLGAAVQT